jgi:hypothetical protein
MEVEEEVEKPLKNEACESIVFILNRLNNK